MIIKAYAEENPVFTTPSFDGGWRVWKKSDPATTGTNIFLLFTKMVYIFFVFFCFVCLLYLLRRVELMTYTRK